ncbi:mitochondrial protein required for respiration [Kwoniella heveanensis CBS 569]|nr:mitochondrial protein required for respiration [Kwoniella heveanensis CBS 569]
MSRPAISSLAPALRRPFSAQITVRPKAAFPSSSCSPVPRLTLRSSSSSASSANANVPRYTTKKTSASNLFKPTTIILICVPILTGFLGVWQLKRLKWKLELIDEVDRNLQKPPMLLPANINLSALPDFSFRRVIIRGKFEGPPILFGPQTKDGFPGYHLILPFARSDGSTILVNRGFITTTRATAIRERRQAAPGLNIDGGSDGKEYEVEGMLTRKGERTIWSPENNVKTNEWFWKDVEGMAEWAKVASGGEREVQPVLVDAIEEPDSSYTLLMNQGVPVGRPPQVELRNQHAQYAAIWLSLSASTAGMLVYVLTKGKAQPSRRPRI